MGMEIQFGAIIWMLQNQNCKGMKSYNIYFQKNKIEIRPFYKKKTYQPFVKKNILLLQKKHINL